MNTALIFLAAAAVLSLFYWMMAKVTRIVIGLDESLCPHCGQKDSLDFLYTGPCSSFYRPGAPTGHILFCRHCRKICSYSDVFPSRNAAPPAA